MQLDYSKKLQILCMLLIDLVCHPPSPVNVACWKIAWSCWFDFVKIIIIAVS